MDGGGEGSSGGSSDVGRTVDWNGCGGVEGVWFVEGEYVGDGEAGCGVCEQEDHSCGNETGY